MDTDHQDDDTADTPPLPTGFVTALELREIRRSADSCGATGCTRDDHLRPVTVGQARLRVLCHYHAKHALGVST